MANTRLTLTPLEPVTPPHPLPVLEPDEPEQEPGVHSSEPEQPPSGWHDFVSTLTILGIALLMALFIISFVFRSYQVDGPSMQQTLQHNDKLIIWKVPRSWAKLTGHDYIPARGDVVVFTEGSLSQFEQDDKQLIKRVIALPGERIILKDGKYTVYNAARPDGFNPDTSLPYGRDIPVTTGDNVDYTLSEHQIFVSGDNRPNSLDSRAFGPINADQVIGKLILRVFPIDKAKVF